MGRPLLDVKRPEPQFHEPVQTPVYAQGAGVSHALSEGGEWPVVLRRLSAQEYGGRGKGGAPEFRAGGGVVLGGSMVVRGDGYGGSGQAGKSGSAGGASRTADKAEGSMFVGQEGGTRQEEGRLEFAQNPSPPLVAYHVPPMIGYGSNVMHGLNVCPVQVGAAPMPPVVYPLPLENIRAGAQAAGVIEPRFDGNFADFEVKWPIYLRQLTELYPMSITEGIKLNLLKGAIGSSAQTELERRYEANESIKYQDFWNWVRAKYGVDVQTATWEKFKALRPRSEGKLKLKDWQDYAGRIRLLYARLEAPSPEDVWKTLVEKNSDRHEASLLEGTSKEGPPNKNFWAKGRDHSPGGWSSEADYWRRFGGYLS